MYERNLAQERNAVFVGHILSAVTAEDVVAVFRQLGRSKPRHVFDDAQDRFVHLRVAEHVDALFDIGEGDGLRGSDDDGAAERNVVYQRDVDVAGSRRQVDEQEVEMSPFDLQEHLLERIAGHRTPPDQGLFRPGEIADAHPFHAVFFNRDDDLLAAVVDFSVDGERIAHLVIDFHFGDVFLGTGHLRDGRTVHIGISQADFVAEPGECDGQVDGYGGFADTALSGGDGNDAADVKKLFHAEFERAFLRLGFRGIRVIGPLDFVGIHGLFRNFVKIASFYDKDTEYSDSSR